MTNADRIRNMTDEELSMFISSCQCCVLYGDECNYPYCNSMNGMWCYGIKTNRSKAHLEWLRKGIEE